MRQTSMRSLPPVRSRPWRALRLLIGATIGLAVARPAASGLVASGQERVPRPEAGRGASGSPSPKTVSHLYQPDASHRGNTGQWASTKARCRTCWRGCARRGPKKPRTLTS